MKIVIKDLQSGLYFKAPTQWTAFLKSAFDFRTLTDALRVGRECTIAAFTVLLELPLENNSIQLAKWAADASILTAREIAIMH
jgi:hypothetical protein